MEGFKSMLNYLGRNRIEQDAEADLLAVRLFADVWLIVKLKDLLWCKKARQLAQAA